MTAHMSRETAQHMVAEQRNYGVTNDGMIALFQNRAHDALGYINWPEFVAAELADVIKRLSDEEKAALATAMRQAGVSLRGISAVVLWSHTKVQQRTHDSVGNAPTALGSDGNRYRQPRSRKTYASSVLDAGWDLRNVAERLTDLIHDERFEVVRDDVADQLRSHLLVAHKATDSQLDNLGKAPTS